MPIYEYKCDLCNGLWEEIQKFSDDPLTVCKSCEKEGGVHKLVAGRLAFHLKGPGWAKDGYVDKTPPSKDLTKKFIRDVYTEDTSFSGEADMQDQFAGMDPMKKEV